MSEGEFDDLTLAELKEMLIDALKYGIPSDKDYFKRLVTKIKERERDAEAEETR